MFLGYQLRDRMPWDNSSNSQSFGSPLDEVIDLIETRYVDDVNTDSLTSESIESIVTHLDPHTQYIAAEDVEGINEDLEGRFVGIGIEFELLEDTVHIIHVIQNGPSEKAGLKTGDKLIKVENLSVTGKQITADSIKGLIKGAINSKVKITVLRFGETKLFTITRNFIPLDALDAAYMLMPSTGYIRLNKFSETTYEEFMAALEKLQQSGLKDLVLDLRGNGGGMLNEAIEMADEFLGGDKLIVYTQGAHLAKKEYKKSFKKLLASFLRVYF
jgi:carboxyl-terminal processing protease